MIKFHCIASSSAGCVYVLESDRDGVKPLLIECGIPYSKLVVDSPFKLNDMAACLISHAHGDHSKSVLGILENTSMPVVAGDQAWAEMSIRYGFEAPRFARRIVCMEHNENWCTGGWSITAYSVPHDEETQCLGYVVSDGYESGLYFSDGAYIPVTAAVDHLWVEVNHDVAILKDRLKTEDLAKHHVRSVESHHSIERFEAYLGKLLPENAANLKTITLLHLSDENSNEAEFKRRIQRLTGKPVHVAQKRGGVK